MITDADVKKAIKQAVFGIFCDDAEARIFGLYGVLKELKVTPSDFRVKAEDEGYDVNDWQIDEYIEFLDYKEPRL